MKKIYLLFVLTWGASQIFSQTLFTYGTNSVGKDEFLRAYNKNKTPVADKEKSLREYLDLYSRFKLKVKAAREMKLDTLQQLQYDMQSFRSQVEDGYMNDEKGLSDLVDEALIRSQKDIHLIHFYVPLAGNDSADASKTLNKLADELRKGTADKEAVKMVTAKHMEIKTSDIGYITALSVPYEIENLVYALKPGEVTKIYRTKTALHIFKNAGERKSAGRWKIAQLLLAIPPGAAAEKQKEIENKADSLYALLMAGTDFAETAKNNSEDKLTYLNGGEMPEFGTGKFDQAFESKVFELKKDGDISKPIFTGYGYHIVKRLQQHPTPADKSDESFVYALKQQILQDPRINAAKASFLKEVKGKIGYKRNVAVKDEELFRYADSVSEDKEIGKYPISNKVIFSFAKSNVKGADWLNFVKDYKHNPDVYKGENDKELLDKYIATASTEYYRKYMEEYNTDFKYQMQEFKEGNMLFEIMERNVWSKAANDSIGLKKYYEEHKAKYLWAESADILLFNCSNAKAAQDATSALHSGKDWKKIAEESEGKVQSDSGRYELSQVQLPAGVSATEGMISTPVINSSDNTSSFVKVLKIYPANQQRSFEEARGLVINEYQNFLEEKWITELKKKYPVKVNEGEFKSLLK